MGTVRQIHHPCHRDSHRRRQQRHGQSPTWRLVQGVALCVAAMAAIGVLVAAPPVQAQRVEVGGNVSGFLTPDGGRFAPGFRLGLNLTPRWAIEGNVDSMRFEFDDRSSDIDWLYFLQLRHTIKPGTKPGDGLFLTYGGAGAFTYHKWKAQQIALGDGRTLITQEATRWEVTRPLYLTLGAGFQQKLTNWLAFRADAQLLADPSGGFATRFTGGVTIPVGGFGT